MGDDVISGMSYTEGWRSICSDMSTFFDDVKAVRPTAMMLIPRLANMMYDQAQEKLKRAECWEKQVSTPAWPHH